MHANKPTNTHPYKQSHTSRQTNTHSYIFLKKGFTRVRPSINTAKLLCLKPLSEAWVNQWTDESVDGWISGRMNQWTAEWMVGSEDSWWHEMTTSTHKTFARSCLKTCVSDVARRLETLQVWYTVVSAWCWQRVHIPILQHCLSACDEFIHDTNRKPNDKKSKQTKRRKRKKRNEERGNRVRVRGEGQERGNRVRVRGEGQERGNRVRVRGEGRERGKRVRVRGEG